MGLRAALGFALVDTQSVPAPKEIQLVREWLDTWTGIGHVVTGMARQDYDLELTRYDGRGWGATFYVAGVEHSLIGRTASDGSGDLGQSSWGLLAQGPIAHRGAQIKLRHCPGHGARPLCRGR